MKRIETWSQNLSDCILRAAAMPFAYGQIDCCLFAADGVLAMTAIDPAGAWRGTYGNALGAYRVLKSLGGSIEAMLETMAKRYQWRAAATPERGDVVFIPAKNDVADADMGGFAGICLGPIAAAFIDKQGLVFLRLKDVGRSFRIEECRTF